MENGRYRIALVDDHTLFRNGLRGLLATCPGCEIVGEAACGEDFLALLSSTDVDLVFMDIAMPGMTGDEATERALALRPDLKVITLSMFGDEAYYTRMMTVGAKGFLLKDSDFEEVVEAMETVLDGGTYICRRLLEALAQRLRRTDTLEEDMLSGRELEVLLLVCRGLSNQEIADQLFISKRTVDKHRANILEKTGCRNTAHLVVYAIKHGLVSV